MGLPARTRYLAYDIHAPRVSFLNAYFQMEGLTGEAILRDILVEPPTDTADAAFLFKEAHRFEEREAGCNRDLWRALNVKTLYVSLPPFSMTGRHDLTIKNRKLVERSTVGRKLAGQRIEFPERAGLCDREIMAKKKTPSLKQKLIPMRFWHATARWSQQETYACILAELDRALPQGLRTNQLQGITPEVVTGWQAKYGWELKPVPFCENGWQVLSATTPPSQTVEHLMGAYYIQEASSMLPPELFDYDSVTPELVLDLAASPGGKTTHLVDKMCDRGLVIANDASRSRIQALRLALERWGAINVAITCQPGELFGAWFPGMFDKVLIDAPCSMEGLRTAESHPMRPVTGRERESLASRQVRLLVSALRAVRTGGQVVYSTCTLAPEEDEAVLLAIKQRFGTAVEIVNPRLILNAPALQLPEAGAVPGDQPGLAHLAPLI